MTNPYEWGTRRLATSRVDRQGVPGVDQHNTYTYDQAGNVLSLSDVSREGTDTQCFTYDHLRRLTEAWTQGTKTCAPAPGKETTGGVAPYWHSYTYDQAGNRRTETRHDTTGDAGKDIERTYTYPAPDAPQPYSLTSVRQTGPTGTSKDTFTYDQASNTTGRTRGGDTQELTWDEEGLLSKATGASGDEQGTTEYVYDADGNRLLARTKDRTTFYWGGHRPGLDFTDAERQKVYDANAVKNGGEYRCDYCGQKVERRGSRDANGNPVPGRSNDAQIDHIEPRVGGGHGGAHNGAVACRRCNRDKSTKTMEEWDDELRDFLGP
ncbi:HNH endonuclease [Streptomyces albus]|uniref:HNH endonuclease n=1 Tax=Streptomyces albus TaxID=1888 RepID=UPI0034000770